MPAKQFPRAWDRGSRSCSDAELERSQHRCARSFPPVAFHRASYHRDAAWAPTHMGGPFLPSLGQRHTVPRMPEKLARREDRHRSSEDVCLFAMVSEGILRAQCFVSCVTIRSRPDNPCENDPRTDDLPCYVPQQFHRSGVHALDIACPFTACTPRGRPKLDRQSVSNCYLSVALVNAPNDLTSRFVSEQLVGLEVANRASEFINDPHLNSAVGECDLHRHLTLA